MSDRRRYERTPSAIRVELSHPAFGTIQGFTRDISDGGAQVCIEHAPIPPVGTEVNVVFRKVAGPINDSPVAMRIVHTHKNLAGLMFIRY